MARTEKNKVKVRQVGPNKEQQNHVINEQELQGEFPEESLSTGPNSTEGHRSVDAKKQRVIDRLPPLGNEFGDGDGNPGGALSYLLLLRHDFKSKDSIFN